MNLFNVVFAPLGWLVAALLLWRLGGGAIPIAAMVALYLMSVWRVWGIRVSLKAEGGWSVTRSEP